MLNQIYNYPKHKSNLFAHRPECKKTRSLIELICLSRNFKCLFLCFFKQIYMQDRYKMINSIQN